MKKIFLLIITLIFITPLTIKAVEINETTIIGKEQITVGESFTESILISFNELKQTYDQTQGIFYLKYELTFDDEIFSITAQESPDWDTIIYQEGDKYYVLSIVNTDNKLKNNCPNSFLYCGDYQNTIEFFPNKTVSTTTEISISNFELATLEISHTNQEYTIDDLIITPIENIKNHSLIIKQPENNNEDINAKENIITNITPEDVNNKIIKSLHQEPVISEIPSNLLSNIEIKGYQFEFNKYKNNYTIVISNDINSLDLVITTEDETASYEIIGNEDLNDNSKIIIEVTSSTKEINIYTLNIDIIEDNEAENSPPKKVSLMTFKEIYHKYKVYIIASSIIIGVFLLILLIIKIISKIKDKKIEDLTNKF